MLTDKDKAGLLSFGCEIIEMATKKGRSKQEIAVIATKMTFDLLTRLPDACAAEVDEFFIYYKGNHTATKKLFKRLRRSGLL
tara:strand:+ start:38 stop:283 length:246 start_codon:yes stop_codon:yes gene_type:complete